MMVMMMMAMMMMVMTMVVMQLFKTKFFLEYLVSWYGLVHYFLPGLGTRSVLCCTVQYCTVLHQAPHHGRAQVHVQSLHLRAQEHPGPQPSQVRTC